MPAGTRTIAVTGLNATDNPAPGVAVLRCLRDACPHDRLVGLAYDALDPGAYAAGLIDDVFMLPYPSSDPDAFFERLCQIHAELPLSVVIPTLDAELPVFIELAPRLRQLGIAALLPTREQFDYQNTESAIAMFWDHEGRENFFMRDLMEYCRRVNSLDFVGVLSGAALPEAVRWPPRTKEAAEHLELWMTITANEAITALEKGADWSGVKSYLDVGGGDATIACALVGKLDELQATVFNLPASAELARARIAREKLASRVKVVEGNFLEDELPKGFDRVVFSRVLADWDPAVCQMLLKKARAALNPGGTLVISEPFDDTNYDLAVSWEFRYAFYDDFGVQTYKSVAQYQQMLRNAGFTQFNLVDRIEDTLYGVLTAR